MSDEIKHECAVAMVVLRGPPVSTGDFGGTKLSLLMEKQHNRGQDGAGAAVLSANPVPGEEPYWIAKSASATPLADVLASIAKRPRISHGVTEDTELDTENRVLSSRGVTEGTELGASELEHTLLLAGNFNLTNAHELFDDYSRHGSFPTSKADGYLICELIAHELTQKHGDTETPPIAVALSTALANADGAWTLCGATGDGWSFATRDPHGIRPGFYYVSDDVVAVASERPAIQAAFDVAPEAVKELPPGQALVISPNGEVSFKSLTHSDTPALQHSTNITPCVFERIYFSRANDADIHRERKALGAALVPSVLKAAGEPLENIFFSYIPNSSRIAFHGLLEELFGKVLTQRHRDTEIARTRSEAPASETLCDSEPLSLCVKSLPRFGEIAVKDAKFRTFIADAAARREFYKHVYDVTYGLVRPGRDTLVVLDDSIVRGNTMKNAILPMLDRLGPKRIVIASSAPPIRYPDCYGIDMSTLSELVAFRALVNLLGEDANDILHDALASEAKNPLAPLYARFTEEQHAAEIARLLTPPGMKAEVNVVYQTVAALHVACPGSSGDWYFTGNYPTPGGYKVLGKALKNYLDKNSERSY